MPHNKETWNDSGQPVGGTYDHEHFVVFKTLDDGTLVTTGATGSSGGNVVIVPPTLTPDAPTSATVGMASSQILAANAARTGLVIVNLSSTTVSFGLGVSAVLNSGISLTGGGIWEMDSFLFTTDAIFAIASDTTSLSIQEFS